jgi:hypothetical protein
MGNAPRLQPISRNCLTNISGRKKVWSILPGPGRKNGFGRLIYEKAIRALVFTGLWRYWIYDAAPP